ncbi:phage portal protein [Macrococcoides goetzii]|uniref:Phage portal protein n=1 Tax=Macrococcoides goetzii TaxID=1891097 RepID=A0A2G5NUQ8_9STAP|nr:phage portal protein [Macrococcus goetzii]RAI79678.1 phage portal protein [Macrococcus goetzii]
MSDVRLYFEEVLDNMRREETESRGRLIKRLIDEHVYVVQKQRVGHLYYNDEPDILLRPRPKDPLGQIDEDKPHNLLVANFHPNQVDQKVGYLLAEPINFKAENTTILEKIGEVLNDDFDDMMNDILTAASNKGVEWLHVYYDDKGNFRYRQIPAEQIVPVYDEYGDLVTVIRHYLLKDVERAEVWNAETVSYWMLEGGEFVPDYYWGEHETYHHSNGSWDKIPFIPFKNNSQEKGDIWKYKTLIDAFNNRLSDLQNTFDESTEIIFALKGFRGQGLKEFMAGLKHYKAVNLGSDGGIDTISVKIPIDETEKYLKMLREMIIDFGRGVDFNSDKFGNSPSGVALKILYSGLDIKAKQLERKTRVALKELLFFVFKHQGINADPQDVEMKFNYNRLKNDMEDTQIATMSKGIVSDITIVTNHPWTDDPQGELERLEEQEMAMNDILPQIEVGAEDEPGTD